MIIGCIYSHLRLAFALISCLLAACGADVPGRSTQDSGNSGDGPRIAAAPRTPVTTILLTPAPATPGTQPAPVLYLAGGPLAGQEMERRLWDTDRRSGNEANGCLMTEDEPAAVRQPPRRRRPILLTGGISSHNPSVITDCSSILITATDSGRLASALISGSGDGPLLAVLRQRIGAGIPVGMMGRAAAAAGALAMPPAATADNIPAIYGSSPRPPAGLDLLSGVIIDPEAIRNGLLGRDVAALRASSRQLLLGMDDSSLLIARPGAFWEVAGDGAISLLDRKDATDSGSTIGWRYSLLWPGDRFDPVTGDVKAAVQAQPKVETIRRGPARNDVFADDGLRDLLFRLADPSIDRVIGRADEGYIRITLRKDERSQVFDDGRGHPTLIRIRLDVEIARPPVITSPPATSPKPTASPTTTARPAAPLRPAPKPSSR